MGDILGDLMGGGEGGKGRAAAVIRMTRGCMIIKASAELNPMTLQEILESVRRVEIRTNRLVNDMMVGAYLSRFKGRGMDFEELREYIPGDDVRDIDWNVTNRMGRPFVKRFREERELGVILAWMSPASSAFGSTRRSKRESAVEIAATLAGVRRPQQRQGGPAAVHGARRNCSCRRARAAAIFCGPSRKCCSSSPRQRGTDIPAALTFLNHVVKRRSIVFLFTDFLHSFGDGRAQFAGGARYGPGNRHDQLPA